MKNKSSIIFLLGALALLSGDRVHAGGLEVVTTLPSLASITRSIGGDAVEVYSITRGAQDAHYVEAKPSYMRKLHNADLLIYSGLELEIGWLPLLIQGARNEVVSAGAKGNLNAALALPAEGILEKPRGEVDRSMGDVHPLGNPHYLLNPYHAIDVSRLITDKLCDLDPEHRDIFQRNRDSFIDTLTGMIRNFETEAAHLKGLEVVCYHNHWSYFLDWLGLEPAGYIELRPGIPPTPQHKRAVIDLMNAKQIRVVIISSWKEPTKAEEVAGSSGAELVILPGEVGAVDGAEDYLSWMEYLVAQVIDAFGEAADDGRKHHHYREHHRKRGTQ